MGGPAPGPGKVLAKAAAAAEEEDPFAGLVAPHVRARTQRYAEWRTMRLQAAYGEAEAAAESARELLRRLGLPGALEAQVSLRAGGLSLSQPSAGERSAGGTAGQGRGGERRRRRGARVRVADSRQVLRAGGETRLNELHTAKEQLEAEARRLIAATAAALDEEARHQSPTQTPSQVGLLCFLLVF